MSELNTTEFSSFFQETIVDNNGIAVTDINAGLVNLFKKYNEYKDTFYSKQRYLVAEFEEGYPDLVAANSILGNHNYWWWLCLLNNLDDPMTDIKANWVYSINDIDEISIFVNTTNQENNESDNRIGSVLELN